MKKDTTSNTTNDSLQGSGRDLIHKCLERGWIGFNLSGRGSEREGEQRTTVSEGVEEEGIRKERKEKGREERIPCNKSFSFPFLSVE